MSENIGKQQFETISVPAELSQTVCRGIRRGKAMLLLRSASSVIAAALVIIFAAANIPSMYARAAELPLLAPIVRMMRVGSGGSRTAGAAGTVEVGAHSLTVIFTDGEGTPIPVPAFSAARRKLPRLLTLRIHGMAEEASLNLWEALSSQEAIADAYPLWSTDPAEQGVTLHLNPGWDCTVLQQGNRLTLHFTWEAPEMSPESGYVLSSPSMAPGPELAELTESLLWEGAAQLRLQGQDYRVVLGEFPTREQAEKAQKTIFETKNIHLEILPIPREKP